MSSTPFLKQLDTDGAYALVMAGQATPWRAALEDCASDQSIRLQLESALAASRELIGAVGLDLTTLGTPPVQIPESGQASTAGTSNRESVQGVLLAQLGALIGLDLDGLDVKAKAPVAVAGHSQGVLGVDLLQAWIAGDSEALNRVLAISELIGSAADRVCRRIGLHRSGDATAMLSVRGVPEAALREVIDGLEGLSAPLAVGVRNDRTTHVVSGVPSDLAALESGIEDLVAADQARHKAREVGGTPMNAQLDWLDVEAPFHSELLEPAVEQTVAWARQCGLDTALAERLARGVLTDHVDWPAEVESVVAAGAQWILDLGPGDTLARMTRPLVQGSGVGVVAADSQSARDKLATPGFAPEATADWSSFAPRVLQLATGERVLDTRFTRLTGRSPVMLAGMTPTTVDPEIVAAAANAGYWAELAGGGQVTEEVYQENLAGLKEMLDPGRTAQFNSMFLDRYLWNLQFGGARIVSKSRVAGAPIDGVVVSAGIPELDEADELIAQLNSEGFPYIAFKPGTADQIRKVLAIAAQVPDTAVIMQVEDGRSGGHHSWEDLDQLLISTYAAIRAQENVILTVGGGIGTPDRAAEVLSGEWAKRHHLPLMPVDAVFIGTAAMTAKEAKTTPEVKQKLVETPGVSFDDAQSGWVSPGEVRGGVTSGLSHLRADLHEVDNSAAAAARLIASLGSDAANIQAHRDELIEAMNKTAKPYFGELSEMTYAQWVTRFADLSFPWADPTWADRFLHLLQRVEARLNEAEHGPIQTLFPDTESVVEAPAAVARLLEAYPQAADITVTPLDAAWFPQLCREFPKPMPFVPVIDDDILRWWGQDCLWQSQDPRYTADQVRIIPGPVAVGGIDSVDEPVGEILGRLETAAVARAEQLGNPVINAVARLGGPEQASLTIEEFLRTVPHIQWMGHLVENPAHLLPADAVALERTANGIDLVVDFDTWWDTHPGQGTHAVQSLTIPLLLPESLATGAVPVVDPERLGEQMHAMLAATAGVGSTSVCGDKITALPEMQPSDRSEFGEAHYRFTLAPTLGPDHAAVTGGALPGDYQTAAWAPDALLGPCWPAIYAALGSAVRDTYPVIEGLLNAVHLDHSIELRETPEAMIARGVKQIEAVSRVAALEESSAGRVVLVALDLRDESGTLVGTTQERFAIRGRITSTELPSEAPVAGGALREVVETPRSTLRKVRVTAPADMTPFAIVSGDFNPIHTSYNAAKVAGMDAPLVHGMWLSATAQHAVEAATDELGHVITGWTYAMFGMVALSDQVEITVERVGSIVGGGLDLEVTCRIDGGVVSKATVSTAPLRTAYAYPGQGIQAQGMGLDERAQSKAVDNTWRIADEATRKQLGFSILTVVRDNPTELTANGVTYRHPEGVLNLTQFTQVALATLAYGQTERLREEGALADGSFYAGHSLGEYNALAACARVFPLETVLAIVFHRGATMHGLVPRDENGRSNYRMGALRPNQFGVGDDQIRDYIAGVAEQSGEFLEIVNYNLSGQQYAVAGTIAGLKALQADATARTKAAGGKNPFMYVPGIDVPFHSSVLRAGVPEFRDRLDEYLPADLDAQVLIGRYIPNLVARPFEVTREFAQSILEVVPADAIQRIVDDGAEWDRVAAQPGGVARLLLIELLCWQFASPVRWIETQDLMFRRVADGGLGVEEFVEIGLGASPTLAGLASKTLAMPEFRESTVEVFNVQRDAAKVYSTDVRTFDDLDDEIDEGGAAAVPASASLPAPADEPSGVNDTQDATEAEGVAGGPIAAAPVAAAPAASGGPAPEDLPFTASSAIRMLLANESKIRPDQVSDLDTVETLTNGVSSRRNQLLMDLSAELGMSSIDGAAEADIAALSATVDRLAHNYKPFGGVLNAVVRERVRKLFGSAGVSQSRVAERAAEGWGLGEGWGTHALAEIVLGTRDGASTRGGDLATLPVDAPSNAAAADALIDAALQAVAAREGVAIAPLATGGGAGGGVVDSAALDAYAATVTGPDGVLATAARTVLKQLGLDDVIAVEESDDSDATVVEAVAAELGSDWADMVKPAFDVRRVVEIDDRWATAREDLARLWTEGTLPETTSFVGTGEAVALQAEYWRDRANSEGRADLAGRFQQFADDARSTEAGQYAGDIALVTGVTPTSIGGAVVADLLAGGATVIATASSVDAKRLDFAKRMYREHARGGARLWMVPANLSSYRDVDALIDWIGTEQTETVGASQHLVKPAYAPTLFFPFAAPRVSGTMADAGPQTEKQYRLLLWSVERSIAGLSSLGVDTDVAHRLHVVLPGSPNRGIFGGDGAYAEAKASFDAILTRWSAEPWGQHVSLVQPLIGWVRGTGLMGGNDPMVEAVEKRGVRTWGTDEMAQQLLALCTPEKRAAAAQAPETVDLTGGLGEQKLDMRELREEAEASAAAAAASSSIDDAQESATIPALPSPVRAAVQHVDPAQWGTVTADLDDTIVIVGTGEVSAWGSNRTRVEAELGIHSDGTVDLTPAGVLELAWMTGLLTWSDSPEPGWYDADGTIVDEADIFDRFRDEVVARSGVRTFHQDGPLGDGDTELATEVFLDREITFSVDTREEALEYKDADPKMTFVSEDPATGEWTVTRLKGAQVRVPKRATITRFIGGQLPEGFDPTRWGIPASMIDSIDRIAVWNLVTAVDAFVSAGFTPAELLRIVHPSEVASTQGTGFGGMTSMHKLFVKRFLGDTLQTDILQETLPNVVAAHTMQSYIGGYGSMIHPVGACATAAVSIEEGIDKITCGKADFVVTGAIDDIQVESVYGFGSMNATADSQAMLDKGISERFVSRPNDRRRGGFVEAMGGGTVLITRASIALEMGLPVLAVVAHAQTFADGAHTSIPAPGIGALAVARGGSESKLAKNLRALGVTIDDVSVLSKHDTSTHANDPNESDLHTRLGRALGRREGNPLYVISQKALTGHAKGGAAVFQMAGLTQVFRSGMVPGAAALDCVDPEMQEFPNLVWLRSPLNVGFVKAAMCTSLGFGHVSSVVALVHPGAFEAMVAASGADGEAKLAAWREASDARLAAGVRQIQAGMIGRQDLYVPVEGRRLPEASRTVDPHEVEAAMLLDPSARLGDDGVYSA